MIEAQWIVKDYRPRGPAIRIAINGRFLDEVITLRENDCGADREEDDDAYMSFGMEHFRAGFDGDAAMLYLPIVTAVQLYHDGVLPSDRHRPIQLTLGTRTTRPLYVDWMRHVAKSPRHPERVVVRLSPTPPPQESA
jgi:hypothetical protein